MFTRVRVAVCQALSVPRDIEANVLKTRLVAQQAMTEGAQLVLFPELFLTGYDIGADHLRDLAITQDQLRSYISPICRLFNISICTAYPEKVILSPSSTLNNTRYIVYNSATLFNAEGEIVLNYRKTHLWSDYENSVFTPGDNLQFSVTNLSLSSPPFSNSPNSNSNSKNKGKKTTIRVGILICYDIEFPEPARLLFLQEVQLLLIPTALSNSPTSSIIPKSVVPTRASENITFIAYSNFPSHRQIIQTYSTSTNAICNISNRTGEGKKKDLLRWSSESGSLEEYKGRLEFCGQSCIISPKGYELQRASMSQEVLLIADIDNKEINEHQQQNPYRRDRLPLLYTNLVNSAALKLHSAL